MDRAGKRGVAIDLLLACAENDTRPDKRDLIGPCGLEPLPGGIELLERVPQK